MRRAGDTGTRNEEGWIPCPYCGQPIVEEMDGDHCSGCGITWPWSIELGDGRIVQSDRPPAAVLAAILRMDATLTTGRKPSAADTALVVDWLNEQEDRYPTEGTAR